MSKIEIPEDIAALARKVGRQFRSEQDLADFSRLLKKITVEAALGGEIDDHLGYYKHEARGRGTGNSRNGYSRKTLKGDHSSIESVNSVIRKAVKNRKVFPHDQAAMKVVYLAIDAAAKKWTMPIRNWKGALNRFMIEFPERMPETL